MSKVRRLAVVQKDKCVACGSCVKVCSRKAIGVPNGIYAIVSKELCVGCGLCARECPATVIYMGKMEEVVKNEK